MLIHVKSDETKKNNEEGGTDRLMHIFFMGVRQLFVFFFVFISSLIFHRHEHNLN